MKKLFLSFVLIAALFSCREKSQVDVQPPVITSVMLNDSSSAAHIVQAPSTISIHVTATDNKELNQIKVQIVPVDFRNTNSNFGLNTGEFEYTQIFNTSGLSSTQHLEVALPDSISGNWFLKVDVSDDYGYLSSPYSTLLTIENPALPTITATTLPAIDNGVITMTEGTNLSVDGTVFDSDSLSFVQVRIESVSGTVLDSIDIPFTNTGVSFTPTFDQASAGHYFLVIEGRDQLGYRKLWSAHVVVN
jgi:hypothetical protein